MHSEHGGDMMQAVDGIESTQHPRRQHQWHGIQLTVRDFFFVFFRVFGHHDSP